MKAERWRIVTEIFHAALEQPSDQRASYLAQACRQDYLLRADVEALLAGDDRASDIADPLVSAPAALSPGTVLGPYRVDAFLGAGGMGEVYRACDTRLKRDVAVKVLPARVSADPGRLARFEREAHAAAALNHPNICAVFDIGMHDGAPFIVSELLEGETLRPVCAAGPLSVRRALEYAIPIARGLAAAHSKGIVHRDLKPENVFITGDGHVKILDFGLAKVVSDLAGETQGPTARPLTEDGIVIGTVGYMSPEQVRGLPTDSRSDIFSFGIALFELLAGRHPFRGETRADTLSAILREDPPALPAEIGAPPVLERILRRCLEKVPSNRFQSADDLAFALEAVTLASSGAAAAVDVPKLRPGWLLPVSAIALAVGAVALAAAWQSSPPRVDPGAYRFTPFATDAETSNHPVWSPDGRSIAYDMSVNGRSQIFVRSLDSDTPVQVTHAPADLSRPFWWPDASRVGFVAAGGEVWSVSPAGAGPERVQKIMVTAATLSPDGRTLALWRADLGTKPRSPFTVWLASPPNATPREYTPAPFKVEGWFTPTYFQFSPDGRQLLLANWTDAGDSAIWLLPFPDGAGSPNRLVPKIPGLAPQLEPSQLSWMPDSERAVMAFRTISAPNGGLWMTDVRTGAATPLSLGLTQHGSPSVSPDGRKIVFTAGGPGYDLVEVPLNGSPMRDFLATGSDEYSGASVPRSSRYVYLTTKNGEEELRIHSQTENWDRLVVAIRAFGETTAMSSPAVSPDGQRVAFAVYGTGGASAASSIWISPVGGGAPIKVTPEGATESGPEWSPDGQTIVCNHDDHGVVGLALIRIGTSEPPRMLADAVAGVIPAWSPNGAWIAYQTNQAVRLVSPDGARQRFLTTTNLSRDLTGYGWDSALVWSRDSTTIYSIRRTEDRNVQMVAIDVVTGALRVVSTLGTGFTFATPTDPGLRFTLTQDARSFLATVMRTRTDLWILEDFAPRGRLLDWFRR